MTAAVAAALTVALTVAAISAAPDVAPVASADAAPVADRPLRLPATLAGLMFGYACVPAPDAAADRLPDLPAGDVYCDADRLLRARAAGVAISAAPDAAADR